MSPDEPTDEDLVRAARAIGQGVRASSWYPLVRAVALVSFWIGVALGLTLGLLVVAIAR